MKRTRAQIVREHGPFPGVSRINGVTFDGRRVWFASGERLSALDPESGEIERTVDTRSHAGTAFDGRHIWQIADDRILQIDPADGRVLATIPAPGAGASGMAWAEGMLWVGEYRARKIHQVDPRTGTVLRTIQSDRFVTGVSWLDGELWHGAREADQSALVRVDADTGQALEQLDLPEGVSVSGLESNGGDAFFCGGGESGKLRVVHRRS